MTNFVRQLSRQKSRKEEVIIEQIEEYNFSTDYEDYNFYGLIGKGASANVYAAKCPKMDNKSIAINNNNKNNDDEISLQINEDDDVDECKYKSYSGSTITDDDYNNDNNDNHIDIKKDDNKETIKNENDTETKKMMFEDEYNYG